MSIKKYVVLEDTERARKHQIVYTYTGSDMGYANEDEAACSLSPTGRAPFVVIPKSALKEI